MDIKLNTNLEVKAKLTEYGKDVFMDYVYGHDESNTILLSKLDDNGWLVAQLWEFIDIFGSENFIKLSVTNSIPLFEENSIIITVRELSVYNDMDELRGYRR